MYLDHLWSEIYPGLSHRRPESQLSLLLPEDKHHPSYIAPGVVQCAALVNSSPAGLRAERVDSGIRRLASELEGG